MCGGGGGGGGGGGEGRERSDICMILLKGEDK